LIFHLSVTPKDICGLVANMAALKPVALPSTQANAHGWHGYVGAQICSMMREALRLPKVLLKKNACGPML
jgi:hypothetical protein